LATGGSTKSGAHGGDGGSVVLLANPIVGIHEFAMGSFAVGGYVDLSGGNSRLGTGGEGGQFNVSIGRLSVSGVNGANSLNVSGGTGSVARASAGAVNIQTFAIQTLPTAFDLTNK